MTCASVSALGRNDACKNDWVGVPISDPTKPREKLQAFFKEAPLESGLPMMTALGAGCAVTRKLK